MRNSLVLGCAYGNAKLNNTIPISRSTMYKQPIIFPELLTAKDLRKLLQGPIYWNRQVTKRRHVPKIWNGCIALTDADIAFYKYVNLRDGRVDIHLPQDLADLLICQKTRDAILAHFPDDFRIAHINLLINPPNPNTQEWHQDNGSVSPDDYYTLLIPLNDCQGMGKTEFVEPYTYDFPKYPQTTIPNVQVGDGLLFSGCLWHRGTPNMSKQTRYCVYMIVSRLPEEELFETW